MQLIGVELQGFRRFGDPVSVRLLESLIAVVGQNESGKTSFLEALEELNTAAEIAGRDQTRRVDISTEIKATFELDEADRSDLSHLDGGEEVKQCTLTKHEDGEITVSLEPKPSHDFEPRKNVRSELESFTESKICEEKVGNRLVNEIEFLIDILDSEEDYLGQDSIKRIQEPVSDLKNVAKNVDSDEYNVERVPQIIDALEDLIEHEKNSPPQKAREILLRRRPQFLIFDNKDRELHSTYDLKEEIPEPSPALENLAELADLNLKKLREAASQGNIALRDDLREAANETLKDEFSQAWVRSDVFPVLSVDGTVLHLNVRTPDRQNRAPIDQRSDGLRWFVALLAFLNQEGAGREPILLVDEAESHLSYDAQAELIEVLEAQTVAQKVIYTTHSAGCLPSDLGRGIRPVIQKEGERSDIKNGFWVSEPGFKPIMVAMGLNPLAFTVARNAVIAEGPSETILLPTLIRQAVDQSDLGYQVAPGASNVGEERISELLSETGKSVIILDGDDAGENTRESLVEAGVDSGKVRTYQDFVEEQLVFEDFIDPEKYVEAVNEELHIWQQPETELQPGELPDMNRVEAVEEWCEDHGLDAPMKPNVCQHLAKQASQGARVVDSARADALERIHEWAKEYFVEIED